MAARRGAGERGAVLILVAIYMVVAVGFAAFVIDIGYAWVLKRHLQASADAAALAGAQDLSNTAVAQTTALAYSGSAGGRNHSASFPPVQTSVAFMAGNTKIRVTATADSPLFFGKIFDVIGAGLDDLHVEATAVASRASTVSGSPIAVYVHELCGNKGFNLNGEDATIQGGIHSNGNYEIKNPGLVAGGSVTIYRQPFTGPPAQVSASLCKTEPGSNATYPAGTTGPVTSDYRPWVTPYNAPADVKAGAPCTHNPSGDVKFDSSTPLTPSAYGVYCLASGKKFTLAGNQTGRITVIADEIEAGGTGKIAPYCMTDGGYTPPASCVDETPVLFYSSGGAPFPAGSEAPTSQSKDLIINPSQAYDWLGYVINRRGGIIVNAAGVTSPLRGLLEAEWITVNGENFQMIGLAPDSPAGNVLGGVALEE